jgi:hypothetical protein
MIINGSSRSNGGFFARHLMRADHNEKVTVVEIRGLIAGNVREAFREMEAVASGTQCKNFFYHANINTRADEVLTPEQWQHAVDTLERELGLTGQARFVVQHAKEGRTHQHIIWSRIDIDRMTAISDSLTYPKHERAARELEQEFGHEAVPSVLVPDRGTPRPERNAQDWETFRGQDSKRDPKAIKAEVTALWFASDSGAAFAAALQERAYILARGDRRDFCIIDTAGDEHSLTRRISGVKAADVRARMADIDREALPSVEEGRALAKQAQDSAEGDAASPADAAVIEPDAPQPDEQSGFAADGGAEASGEPATAMPGGLSGGDDAHIVQVPAYPLAELTQALRSTPSDALQGDELPAEATTPAAEQDPAIAASHEDNAGELVEGAQDSADATDTIPAALGLEQSGHSHLALIVPEASADMSSSAAFLAVESETIALVEASDSGLVMFLPEQSPAASVSPAFEAVERETISQAIDDQAATDAGERDAETGGRFARWWSNMREYVAGWREQILEQARHFLSRWETEEMQERAAEHPPEPSPDETPSPEIDLTP